MRPPATPDHDYRRDVDGLRGLAVLAVLAFHAFPEAVPGGFVGVDVFFVVSGYLITSLLLRDLQAGRFTLVGFYARRVRRIFPALVVVLGACLAAGWHLLLAHEFGQLGLHAAAGAAFSSNLLLSRQGGYFEAASEARPLLHLWSLGIEEQFYIAWPILLWSASKVRSGVPVLTLTAMVISLACSVGGVGLGFSPFYSPVTRAWELLAGAALAQWRPPASASRPRSRADVVAAAAGLTAIAVSLWASPERGYPGAWALLPVAGTVAVLAAPASSALNRVVLASRPLVWIGLISYPLYLWHWPLLSFGHIVVTETPSATLRLACLGLAFGLAWLTTRMLERPVRSSPGRRWALPLTAAMTVAAAGGAMAYRADGVPSRVAAQALWLQGDLGHVEFHRYLASRWPVCAQDGIARGAPRSGGFVRCRQSRADAVETVLLGDSHAEHLFVGLAEQLPASTVAYYVHATPPLLVHEWFARLARDVLARPEIRTVIVAMYWSTYRDAPASIVPPGSSVEREVVRMARQLLDQGKRVYVTDDVPAFPFTPDRCRGRRYGPEPQCTVPYASLVAQFSEADRIVGAITRMDPRIGLLRTRRAFCEGEVCTMAAGGQLLYRDTHHLNLPGSRVAAAALIAQAPELEGTGQRSPARSTASPSR